MKKNGTAVFLMELVLVILFFSLSTTVTLRMFMTAHQQEQQSAQLSTALLQAQDIAEQFRARGTAFFTSSDAWKRTQQADGTTTYRLKADTLLMEVELRTEQATAGCSESGEVRVYAAASAEETTEQPSGEPLCRLSLGRYSPAAEEVAA